MPPSLTNMQLGYLKELVRWINSEAVNNPFTVKLEYGEACFERTKWTAVSSSWENLFQDLQTYADHGYITITLEDSQTYYELAKHTEHVCVAHRGETEGACEGGTETGKEAGK